MLEAQFETCHSSLSGENSLLESRTLDKVMAKFDDERWWVSAWTANNDGVWNRSSTWTPTRLELKRWSDWNVVNVSIIGMDEVNVLVAGFERECLRTSGQL